MPPDKPSEKTLLILALAFTPAAIVIGTITLLVNGVLKNVPDSIALPLLWLACLAAIVCCFVPSFLLFRRRTGLAIVGGLLILLINGFIALFFGCCASFKL